MRRCAIPPRHVSGGGGDGGGNDEGESGKYGD